MSAEVVRDIHVLRYFSSFVSVSHGRVIHVTDPVLSYCPLAAYLYKGLKKTKDISLPALKEEIERAIESKIREHGLFTERRNLSAEDIAIAYGASEMMMFALRKKAADAAVIVCDGAGTIVTDNAALVQGVGARMNSLVLTTPINGVAERLKGAGACLISHNATISQVKGVRKAISLSYKRIVVTVSGHDADRLEEIRSLEKPGHVSVTVLVMCTTLANPEQVNKISKYADIVWSCASQDVRSKIGPQALLQISKQIPVFVMTEKGLDLVAACADDEAIFLILDKGRKYLISRDPHGGQPIKMCGSSCYLREADLPVLSEKSFVLEKTQFS